MKILALELSSGQGSVAWIEDDEVCAAREFPNDRKHSGLFFENLRALVSELGKVDRIVVGLGPGSYAGTRIAIATAIGLQSVWSTELVGVPSVCAFRTRDKEFFALGDARRQSFWFARVRERRCVEGPALFSGAREFDLPVFSAEPLPTFPQATLTHPTAAWLAKVESDQFVRPPLEPLYLREPHITRPKAA